VTGRLFYLMWLVALFALTTFAPSYGGQAGAPTSVAGPLVVVGDVGTALSLEPADLKLLSRTRVEVKEDDRTLAYEGVLVAEILKRAGVPLGSDLRGNALATYVVASAIDGYQVVFSIGELDPAMTSNEIIVADTIDGKPLLPKQGPLRIVAPRDARAARSVRMLTRLEVVRLKK
jgi:DMSO/TMAO reductase YedYZ molybdopterin-dependent catalytic subunit